MKTTLPKSSKEHQEIINRITEIIKEQGGDKIAYIILFGSIARGNWVFDIYTEDNITYEYASDYDFLILIKNHNQGNGQPAYALENAIKQQVSRKYLDREHSISIVIEPLSRVNKKLKEGHYFFSDIKKEGILLYKADDAKALNKAKPLTNQEKVQFAQDHYDYWLERAQSFLIDCNNAFERNDYRSAAFYLHQATESLYNCTELVFTNYKPKIHDIEKLNKRCIPFDKKFKDVFPKDSKEQEKCFDLLRSAYIDARYDRNYSITKEQLEYMVKRVEKLKEITRIACENKINSFKKTNRKSHA